MRIGPEGQLIDRRVTEWRLLEKARKAHAEAPPPASRIAQIITISRQYGAGGNTVANIVAQRLGKDWQVWDTELIEAIAKRADVRRQIVEELDEKTRSWVTEMVSNMVGGPNLDVQGYRHHLGPVLLAVAQQGRKIIVGRGANFILEHALNVRLEASLHFRIRETMRRLNMNHEDAERLTRRLDKERMEFTRAVFGRDVNDPSAYHMVLQTDKLSYETAASVIVAAARELLALKEAK
jgi:cytidylate kinase